MQTQQATQTQSIEQAARQTAQTAQQQPVELTLQQLQAVSGGNGESSTPVKGW